MMACLNPAFCAPFFDYWIPGYSNFSNKTCEAPAW
jgi:hypothetical protein